MLAMLGSKLHFLSRGGIDLSLSVTMTRGERRRPSGASIGDAAPRAVSALLDEYVENEAVLIDGAPEPVCFSGDRNDDFVQMPFVAARRRPPRIRSANSRRTCAPIDAPSHSSRKFPSREQFLAIRRLRERK